MSKKEIPDEIKVPVWYVEEDDGEIVLDREEMVDALERAMGELEDKINKNEKEKNARGSV